VGLVAIGNDSNSPTTRVRLRAEATLPLGDEASFAGERGVVFSPGASAAASSGPWTVGLDLSLRLRQPVTLGDVRHGSEAVTQLGVAGDIMSDQRLTVTAETSWYFGLARAPGGSRWQQLPAEWLLGAASRLTTESSLGLYVGSAIPVSSPSVETTTGTASEQRRAGLSSPDLRLLLAWRLIGQ
jgi:hypothetical protein